MWKDCPLCRRAVPSVAVLAAVFWAAESAQALALVKDGAAKATIVVGTSATAKLAAQELQTCVLKISGAKLPIVGDSGPTAGALILVGPSRHTKALGVAPDRMKPEGFLIRCKGERLILIGRDTPGNPLNVNTQSLPQTGTLSAVYAFLDRFAGVRWYFPSELGEVVPSRRTLIVPETNLEESPSLRMRLLGFQMTYNKQERRRVARWCRRNKLGSSLRGWYGHAFNWFRPKYAKTHPEYFATKGKGRDFRHPCYNHPKVLEIIIARTRKALDRPGLDYWSVSPNDGSGHCDRNCPYCAPLDVEFYKTGRKKGQPVLSDRIFHFVNTVARAVKKTHPNKFVATYAYTAYRTVPERLKVEDNVIVLLSRWEPNFRDPDYLAGDRDALRAWTRTCKRFFIRGHWGNIRSLPLLYTHVLAGELNWLHTQKVTGLSTEVMTDWAAEGLQNWVAAQLLWDPNRDTDALIEQYCNDLFGKAGPPMSAYYAMLEKAFVESDKWWNLFTPEFVARCRKQLNEAQKAATRDIEKRRIAFVGLALMNARLQYDATVLSDAYFAARKKGRQTQEQFVSAGKACKELDDFLRRMDARKDVNAVKVNAIRRRAPRYFAKMLQAYKYVGESTRERFIGDSFFFSKSTYAKMTRHKGVIWSQWSEGHLLARKGGFAEWRVIRDRPIQTFVVVLTINNPVKKGDPKNHLALAVSPGRGKRWKKTDPVAGLGYPFTRKVDLTDKVKGRKRFLLRVIFTPGNRLQLLSLTFDES